jgi:hypothetical protein
VTTPTHPARRTSAVGGRAVRRTRRASGPTDKTSPAARRHRSRTTTNSARSRR